MTLQEIFDKVIIHLRTQNADSMSDYAGGCAYRGADGRQCAIGCLIPDDEYDSDMEGNDVEGLIPYSDAIAGLLHLSEEDYLRLLGALQSLHDDVMCIETIFGSDTRVAATDIAKDFHLNQDALHAPLQ